MKIYEKLMKHNESSWTFMNLMKINKYENLMKINET